MAIPKEGFRMTGKTYFDKMIMFLLALSGFSGIGSRILYEFDMIGKQYYNFATVFCCLLLGTICYFNCRNKK